MSRTKKNRRFARGGNRSAARSGFFGGRRGRRGRRRAGGVHGGFGDFIFDARRLQHGDPQRLRDDQKRGVRRFGRRPVGAVDGARGVAAGSPARPMERFYVSLAVLFALTVVSAAAAEYRFGWWRGFIHWSGALFVAFWASGQLRGENRVRTVAAVITISGAAVSAYGLSQFFNFDWVDFADPQAAHQYAVSTMGNQNYVAQYLIMVIPTALGLGVYASRWWGKTLCAAAAGLCFVHLLLTRCRGAWVGLLLGTCLVAAAVWRARPGGRCSAVGAA